MTDSAENHPDPLVEAALGMVSPGDVVGLGSGRAATRFIRALGARVAAGLQIRGIPTSRSSADLATELGIPLTTFDEVETIDIVIDGADEVDPDLNLIKGLGGALVREKVVATTARRFVILVGPEKLVGRLGEHGVLPVEVVPFAFTVCRRKLESLGYPSVPRSEAGQLYTSDNGNRILDCRVKAFPDPQAAEQTIRSIPGVLGTGLFLAMADTVIIDRGTEAEVRHRPRR
jgi:ribose 5-phosphate isomerase A